MEPINEVITTEPDRQESLSPISEVITADPDRPEDLSPISEIITAELLTAIRKQYRLDWHGIHGIEHWLRVRENGLRIAKAEGANPKVVELFAVLHDACRHNDDHDPEHGPRAAELAQQFRNRYFKLTNAEFAELTHASHDHTKGLTQAPITVQNCWDADRLDLGRVGIEPCDDFLCFKSKKTLQDSVV